MSDDDLTARRVRAVEQSKEDMRKAARSLHDLFLEYCRAGFTRREALHLVAAMVTPPARPDE